MENVRRQIGEIGMENAYELLFMLPLGLKLFGICIVAWWLGLFEVSIFSLHCWYSGSKISGLIMFLLFWC